MLNTLLKLPSLINLDKNLSLNIFRTFTFIKEHRNLLLRGVKGQGAVIYLVQGRIYEGRRENKSSIPLYWPSQHTLRFCSFGYSQNFVPKTIWPFTPTYLSLYSIRSADSRQPQIPPAALRFLIKFTVQTTA